MPKNEKEIAHAAPTSARAGRNDRPERRRSAERDGTGETQMKTRFADRHDRSDATVATGIAESHCRSPTELTCLRRIRASRQIRSVILCRAEVNRSLVRALESLANFRATPVGRSRMTPLHIENALIPVQRNAPLGQSSRCGRWQRAAFGSIAGTFRWQASCRDWDSRQL